MGNEVDQRIEKLERRVTDVVAEVNRVNAKTASRVETAEAAIQGLAQKLIKVGTNTTEISALEKRADTLEKRVVSMESSLNKINAIAHDRIVGLEKKFSKLEKGSAKVAKLADPKKNEKNLMELVEKAMAAFDKAHKK